MSDKTRETITHKAYLVVTLRNIGTPYPIVTNVGIYSSSAGGLTIGAADEVYADVASHVGASFSDAACSLRDFIEKCPALSWVLPWINTSEDAHSAKYWWQIVPRRGRR